MLDEVVKLAVEAMREVEVRRKSEKLALSESAVRLGVERPEAVRFAHRLVLEALKRLGLLDEIIAGALGPGWRDTLKPRTRAFLRLFAYRAVVEEAGRRELLDFLAKAREVLGRGVLRPVEHALGLIMNTRREDVLASRSTDEKLALEFGVPGWLLRAFYKDLGRREALALLRACLSPLPTYIRVNTLKGDEDKVLALLSEEGIEVRPVEGLRHVYEVLAAEKPVVMTRAYREGLVYVQDKASCLAVEVAGPEPGMEVLDVCAAPGAKTSHMAQLMGNEGAIISVDFSLRRMATWRELMGKMGVRIAWPILADARYPLPLRSGADLVLLDLPCTSTGAFSHAPSARWRLSPASPRRMARVQYRILENCSRYVRPGGVLVYVTCSVLVEENEKVVEEFLRRHPDFELEPAEPFVGLPGLRGLSECQRLYPHRHGCDGYFIAKMRRA